MAYRPVTLTHCGPTNETDAVRAVLTAYGWPVIERQVGHPELQRLTGGKGRFHLPFGEDVFHTLGDFLYHLVDKGIASFL